MSAKRLNDLVEGDEKIRVGSYIAYVIRSWWAVVAVALIFGAVGYIYSKIKTERYTAQGSIILNDSDFDGKGTLGGSGLGSLFSSFTMGGSSYKLVEDEIRRLQNRGNLEKVIKMLNLNNVSWSKESLLSPKVFYYNDAPINIDIPMAVLDTISATTRFDITVAEGGKEIEVKAEQPLGKEVLNQTYSKFPILAKTPRGTFRIDKSVTYNPSKELKFHNLIYNQKEYCTVLYDKLDVAAPSKKSNIIYISYKDVNPKRGCDVINNLVAIYNDASVEWGHQEARNAIDFINERMVELYSQLQQSEKSIETFKRENKISDPEIDAKYTLEKKGGAESALMEQRTKAGVTQMIIDFLKSDNTKYSMIPFTSDSPEAPIQAYNELVLERMRLEQNAKGNNASLKGLTAQIDAMRHNLITSMERDLSATKIAVSDLERVNSESDARIGQVPGIERRLTELYRNQTIQNQIYGFMLQKREENQLKLARENPSGRIMEEAYSPSETDGLGGKILILAFAFIGGIFALAGLYLVFWYQRRRDQLAEVAPVQDRI